MCLLCYSSMTNERALEEMQRMSAAPNFEQWNTTSMAGMVYAAHGMSGEECRKLAIPVLERFAGWLSEQPENYFPSTGLEKFPPIEEIREMIKTAKELTPEQLAQNRKCLDELKKHRDEERNARFTSIAPKRTGTSSSFTISVWSIV